jgi:hypothetical protein
LSLDQYWKFVHLDVSGRIRIEIMEPARVFFQQQLPNLTETNNYHREVVQKLLPLYRSSAEGSAAEETQRLAGYCLRCFISNQIEATCFRLHQQFGARHGFSVEELLPYVLTDAIRVLPQEFTPLSIKILQPPYDPDTGSLAIWTDRFVKHDRDLNKFLLEHGVLLLSDWAILNDTKPEQVRPIFTKNDPRPEAEVQQICSLLKGYHAVYRRDRCAQHRTGRERRCSPPTPQQLQEISELLKNQGITLSPKSVLVHLQSLAARLRQHRIQVKTRTILANQSLDEQREDGSSVFDPPASELDAEEAEFLHEYRQALILYLSQAIDEITQERLNSLKPPNDQLWIVALYLVHCQRMSMKAIAPMLNLKAQSQVSRILKLKEFRADVRSCMIGLLKARFLPLAQEYATPDRLLDLDQRLEEAFAERVDEVIQEAGNRSLNSLFARKLCQHLDTYRETYYLDNYRFGENHSTSQSDTQNNQQHQQNNSGAISHD